MRMRERVYTPIIPELFPVYTFHYLLFPKLFRNNPPRPNRSWDTLGKVAAVLSLLQEFVHISLAAEAS